MKCPVCNDVRMREVVKNDVLIDVCPDCKGVWLDRGELDKLMQGVKEMQQEVERLERHSANQGGYGGPVAAPGQPASGPAPGSWAANNAAQSGGIQGTPGSQPASSGTFGQPTQPQNGSYGNQPQAQSYPTVQPINPNSGYGSNQPHVSGGGHQPPYGGQGYGGQNYGRDNYGYDKHGYNKYGHSSHKRNKTVLDIFGELFD